MVEIRADFLLIDHFSPQTRLFLDILSILNTQFVFLLLALFQFSLQYADLSVLLYWFIGDPFALWKCFLAPFWLVLLKLEHLLLKFLDLQVFALHQLNQLGFLARCFSLHFPLKSHKITNLHHSALHFDQHRLYFFYLWCFLFVYLLFQAWNRAFFVYLYRCSVALKFPYQKILVLYNLF